MGIHPDCLPLVSWKFVYAKEKKSSHVISDDIHSICPINRTCPLKKNNNKKNQAYSHFLFVLGDMVLTSHLPFSSLSQVLQTWKGGNEAMPSLSGDAVWRQNWGEGGALAETPSAPKRLLLLPQQLRKGPRLRLLPATSLGSFAQGNKDRGNRAVAEMVLTGAKDFTNWKQWL